MTWADTDYGYKKKITIDHTKVAGDEVNFPILISVTNADLADTDNDGHVESSDGYDIVFYNDKEDTLFKHEIESYTNTDGTLVFWVKVDSLSSTVDTDIYIYYGKAGVVVNPSSTDTWDNQHVIVQHMADNPDTMHITDSTSNGNDGTKSNWNEPDETDGKIAKGQDFDGINDHVNCGNDGTLSPDNEITISVWVNVTNFIALEYPGLVEKDHTEEYDLFFYPIGTWRLICFPGGVRVDIVGIGSLSTGQWYHLTGTYNATTGKGYTYTNGVQSKVYIGDVGILQTSIDDLLIGERDGHFFDGLIDEVRVSNTVRSANWISTMYESENAPDTFMNWDVEEVFIETSIYENSFTLQSDTYTVYITNPEWRGLDGQITKDIALFDFWNGNFSTVDKGIDSRDRHLQGVESVINDINEKVERIWSMQNNKEEVTITRLGETINGIYIIESFDFKTIKGTNAAYSWSINLKFVRDV